MTDAILPGKKSQWACPEGDDCINRIACLGVGVALAAIAAVATYYCIINGLPMLDKAYTSLDQFTAIFLLYSGATFSIVAAVNAGYTGMKFLCNDQSEFEYSPKEATMQAGLSALAPIVVALAIPALFVLGLGLKK